MTITLYGIPNCDTVKKARAWLSDQGAAVRFHDFRREGVPDTLLDGWIAELGWDKLINRKGTTWRRLPSDRQTAVQDASSARELMQAEPSVIRRPVVDWGSERTAGFDADAWLLLLRRSGMA